MTNDFQVEFFSFNYQKQWKLSVCKKVINQVRLNGLYTICYHFLYKAHYDAHSVFVILASEPIWDAYLNWWFWKPYGWSGEKVATWIFGFLGFSNIPSEKESRHHVHLKHYLGTWQFLPYLLDPICYFSSYISNHTLTLHILG